MPASDRKTGTGVTGDPARQVVSYVPVTISAGQDTHVSGALAPLALLVLLGVVAVPPLRRHRGRRRQGPS
jgi:hypothetical protein